MGVLELKYKCMVVELDMLLIILPTWGGLMFGFGFSNPRQTWWR